MAAKMVDDPRIGFRTEDGKIVKNPTAFAMTVRKKTKREGKELVWQFWNRKENPNATKVWFGLNKQYFYVLPPASFGLDDETRQELENLVLEVNKEVVREESVEKVSKNRTTTVVEHKTEEEKS